MYGRLKLWIDANHDGVSEQTELLTLQQAGIESIATYFEVVRDVDRNGNEFRYRASVTGTPMKREWWAWDVYFKVKN